MLILKKERAIVYHRYGRLIQRIKKMMEVLYKVEVSVRTEYLENQSLPSEDKYFSYTVTIKMLVKFLQNLSVVIG